MGRLSAATLPGLSQGDPGAYTLLADGIRQFGHDVPCDLRELWRRLVFSLLASNYDDHLRNHGFLMCEPGRWSPSPAYDLNPVPEVDRVRANKTAIAEDQEEPTIAGALAAAPRFGLKATESKKILREVFVAVSARRKTGRRLRLKAIVLDTYASSFEHPRMDEARQCGGEPIDERYCRSKHIKKLYRIRVCMASPKKGQFPLNACFGGWSNSGNSMAAKKLKRRKNTRFHFATSAPSCGYTIC